ncbi:MAG: DUF1640 domain-containing protein [Nitrospirae bacterium]|nr:DUF1640 domain-containing protein [Nitrospirota bacterium]
MSKVYERLKAADLPEKAAKEIAEIIKDTIEDRLVTKEYLDVRLAEVKIDIIKWVAGMLVAQAALIAALVKLFG